MSSPHQIVYLVSCVKAKRHRPARAKDLYTSDWFKKARAYVEGKHAPWFILSAKYGLVAPNRIIRRYDVTLLKMATRQRRAWSSAVERRLKVVCRPHTRLVLLAGLRYREHLVPALMAYGFQVDIPMEGLSIGKQKAWLKRRVGH
jgi:uncharacterized protein DUF6884